MLDTTVQVTVTDEVSRLMSLTQSATRTTAGQDFTFNLTALPQSDGQAGTLTVVAKGDLDSNGIILNLLLTNPETVTLGFAGQTQVLDIRNADSVVDANGVVLSLTNIPAGVGGEQVTLTKAYAIGGTALQSETADGTMVVTADLSATLNAKIDSRDGVTVTLSYYALVRGGPGKQVVRAGAGPARCGWRPARRRSGRSRRAAAPGSSAPALPPWLSRPGPPAC